VEESGEDAATHTVRSDKRAADNIPQPTSGSTNSNVYNNISEACATKRSCEDMVAGNGGRVLNWRFTKRITTKIRMAIPNGRWMETRQW
jgi:hypothetical protein